MKLLVTRELGRLAKWLRILGIDAEYSRESRASEVILAALRADRAIVTRNHRFPKRRGLRLFLLEKEKIKEQLDELLPMLHLRLSCDEIFTRCVICNTALKEMPRDRVFGRVPEYVFETQEKFTACPSCGRIYWQGTHWGNVARLLEEAGPL